MKSKKIIAIISALAITISSIPAYAAFKDVSTDASYTKSLDRVSSLGIINGTGDGNFSPYDSVTREQFATMIVKAAGLASNADNLKGSSIFIDVDPYGWSTGYINAAVGKGLITGMPDNRFYPESGITFAQACTILVKALGYTDTDLQGTWPKNYIEKAKILGLATGINMVSNDNVPRWAAAVMIDNLLDTQTKSVAAGTSKTFAESTGTYVDGFIFSNPQTNSKLLPNQIQTDSGIYYVPDGMKLDLGGKYRFVVDGDNIVYAYNTNAQVINMSVDSIIDTQVTYKANGVTSTMTLPDKATYYYQGAKINYTDLKSKIQAKSSIVMVYNDDKTGFDYGLVYDPVVSRPYIALADASGIKLPAELNLSNTTIVTDGKTITTNDLEDHDVLYSVSDIWGGNRHILMVRNQIDGTITDILPDKISPKSIQLDSKNYDLGNYFDVSKINATSGSFKLDDKVTLLLGNDGKAVDVYSKDLGDISKYAVVVNTGYILSDAIGSTGKIVYNATLMLTDGSTYTYKVDQNAAALKGKLVTYQKLDDERVYIEEVEYPDLDTTNDHYFAVDERTLDGGYIAKNAKIFNIVSNDQGTAATVNLLDLSDIPRGNVQPAKILYVNKAGAFNDINLIVTQDLFDQKYKLATVKSASGGGSNKNYTLLIDGKEYNFTGPNIPTVTVGSVFNVKMVNGKIDSIVENKTADVETQIIQAVDSQRIKIGSNIYWLGNTSNIYLIDSLDGSIKSIGTDDIDTSLTYAKISVYYDKNPYYGGKVATIVLTE